MSIVTILILALIQGAAELLPVSSSAHVIVAEKLMGLDPTKPEMTFLLIMLHTGTMFAVLAYFWKRWKKLLSKDFILNILVATSVTGLVGLFLKKVIEKIFMAGESKAEIEILFGNLTLISVSLLAAGILIIFAGTRKIPFSRALDVKSSGKIGFIQGLCLPFRGFSRSGATISTGLILGIPKMLAEDFSFALAVVLTPPVILIEWRRLIHARLESDINFQLSTLLAPGLIGMVFSFGAGLLALKFLSSWLENGKWKFFGIYCISAAITVFAMGQAGI